MKSIFCLIVCSFCLVGSAAIYPAMAADPLISLTAKNEPLGDVLETISRDTGFRFNLNRQWKDHPVSATISNMPLEKGLKRLLRSLNHSIVWESDKIVTIMVFGKVDPGNSDTAISFSLPPQTYQEEAESTAEAEPVDTGAEAVGTEVAAEDETKSEPGENAPTPEAGNPGEPPAAAGVVADTQPAVE